MTIPPTEAAAAPATAPALNPPTWTGRKTAVAAALAIGISSVGAAAAAAAVPPGTSLGGGQVHQGGFGPGGGRGPAFGPGGGQGPGIGPGSQVPQAPADPKVSAL